MKKTIKGLIKLSRLSAYFYAVVITTLVGVTTSRSIIDWKLFIVVAGNLLGVSFAFVVNDIKDAPDDVLSGQKTNRNPISSGLVTTKTARLVAFSAAILSLGLLALLGYWTLAIGCLNIFLGFFYSIRRVRSKVIAFRSILSHSLLIAGLPFMAGYFTYTSRLAGQWFWPFIFLLTISITGELHHQGQQVADGRTADRQQDDEFIGERAWHFLLITLMVIVTFSGVMTIFIIQLFPGWAVLTWAVLVIIFLLPPLIRVFQGKRETRIWESFQKPLERSTALTLVLLYFIPWLDQLFDLGFFR